MKRTMFVIVVMVGLLAICSCEGRREVSKLLGKEDRKWFEDYRKRYGKEGKKTINNKCKTFLEMGWW